MNLISCTKTFSVMTESSMEDFDAHTDAIADALFDLEQNNKMLKDSAIGADLKKKTLEITVTVEHAGVEEGRAVATSLINRAIKAAGGDFGGQPSEMVETSQAAKLVAA